MIMNYRQHIEYAVNDLSAFVERFFEHEYLPRLYPDVHDNSERMVRFMLPFFSGNAAQMYEACTFFFSYGLWPSNSTNPQVRTALDAFDNISNRIFSIVRDELTEHGAWNEDMELLWSRCTNDGYSFSYDVDEKLNSMYPEAERIFEEDDDYSLCQTEYTEHIWDKKVNQEEFVR